MAFTVCINIALSGAALAYGIPFVTAISPCGSYSAAYGRSDIVSSYPSYTTDEIYATSVQVVTNIDFILDSGEWLWSGWQYSQAVADYYTFAPDPSSFIGITYANGRFWAWNYPLQTYTTYDVIQDVYYC